MVKGPVNKENVTVTSNGETTTTTGIVIQKESAEAVAMRVLRAINKSTDTGSNIDVIPAELLLGERVDLHRWTLLLTDDDLKRLAEQCSRYRAEGKEFSFIDCGKGDITSMFKTFWGPIISLKGLLSLNLINALKISDWGLALIARHSPHLKELNISGCHQLGDAGLREVGMNCKEISTLMMSGCHGIDGGGLISFAEECEYLLKLDISKCKAIKKWAMHKLFYECKRLEEVNLSHLHEIGDEEVTVLALNCPNLVTFVANDSPYISDQSITALSQHCQDLDLVDVSRDKMTFRISDVTLLALGEKARSLRTLRVNGCDQLTDVGLMWLAEGCKTLEDADFGGCPRISDAGLRSIGGSLRALTSIDLSGAKTISDIGLASLAAGCPSLKRINLHAIFQLADPRISAPKKGAQAEAWQAVVGIAALANNCPQLTDLDLSGCFRLDRALERHVSCLTGIKTLNLTGCNQASAKSLAGVAQSCILIEDLNLTDCGHAVNTLSVEAFSKHCPNLRNVVLKRCHDMQGGAIKALSSCMRLERLDLSYCKNLTDIMVLPLTEAEKMPKLRTLYVVGCELLTDTVLAWLASKDHEILFLALKGTRMTRHALQAVRDRFPYTEMITADDFLGFQPVHRQEDKRLMRRYGILSNGFIKLQARQRAYLAKMRVSGLAAKRQRKRAIITLHRMALMFLAKSRFYYRKIEVFNINRAATRITSMLYIAKALKRCQRRRMEINREFIRRKVTMLQTHWRVYLAKTLRQKRHRERQARLERRRVGATKFQSVVRMFQSFAKIERMLAMRRAREALVRRKCGFIQRCYRGYKGRVKAYWVKVEWIRVNVLKKISTSKIQKAFRVHRTNKIVRKRVAHKAYTLRCCIKIQALMRGALSRLNTAEMILEMHETRINTAAVKIQSGWRVKQARLHIKHMKAEIIRIAKMRHEAAVTMQKYARAKYARRVMAALRETYMESLLAVVQLEIDSATRIQAAFRGMKGRLHFDDELRKRKGKWKELYDEKKRKRFFYNKLTGEIRWRMPQDLLDMIPRPQCDNCVRCAADFECAVCNEMYCGSCFDTVHRGGRRKDHEFRSLYDYYGRRLDYGDGEFPCKWPTEVLQDEIQGWMLRVAPIREPVGEYGDWEEYNEGEVKGGVDSGKTFFFNRTTFETSYDMPPEVHQFKYPAQYETSYSAQLDYNSTSDFYASSLSDCNSFTY